MGTTDPDEAARHELENTFMWSIVTTKFNTAKATELIRKCEDSHDAQKALELISKHYHSSAASDERAKEIWEDITGTSSLRKDAANRSSTSSPSSTRRSCSTTSCHLPAR